MKPCKFSLFLHARKKDFAVSNLLCLAKKVRNKKKKLLPAIGLRNILKNGIVHDLFLIASYKKI